MLDVSTTVNPVAPGGRVLYTITVGNVSTHAVDGVTVSLLLPVGLQFHYIYDSEPNSSPCAGLATCSANGQATWALGTLAAGVSRTIALNAAVLLTVGDGDSIATAFKVSATGINDLSFTKTVQVYSTSSAQLSTGTTTYPLRPGQRFTLDLDVGQLGGTALTGASLQASLAPGLTVVSMSDGGTQAPSGVVSWTIGGLGVGAALHREVEVTVDANVPAGAILGTRATLTYDGGVAIDGVAEYAVVIAPTVPLLSVNVAATPAPAVPNGRLAYTVTVSNLASRAVDGIVLQLRVPPGLRYHYIYDSEPNSGACAGLATCSANLEAFWTVGTLAAGASQTIVVNPEVVANAVGNGNLIRTLFAVTGTGVGEIDVVKTVQVYDSPGAQLALTSTANPVTNAQAFTYNFDIGQIGVNVLAGAELRARLPSGLTVGAISDGGTQVASGEIVWAIGGVTVGADLRRTVAVTGDGTAAPGTILGARASLTYDGGAAVDALTEHAISVISGVQPLTLSLSASPSPAVPGNRLLYTATVTNTSARSVDGVVVLLRVPEGLQFHYINDADPNSGACAGLATCSANLEAFWNLGTMAAGGSQIITVNAQVLTGLLGGSLIAAPFSLTSTGLTDPILLDLVVPAHQ